MRCYGAFFVAAAVHLVGACALQTVEPLCSLGTTARLTSRGLGRSNDVRRRRVCMKALPNDDDPEAERLEDIEEARDAFERLIKLERGSDGSDTQVGEDGQRSTMRFDTSGGRDAPTVVDDDVAAGLQEAQDIGSRGLGVLGLGAVLSLEGLLSPFGLACILLFAALWASGEFGDSPARFIVQAPGAAEGAYYREYDTTAAPYDDDDADGDVTTEAAVRSAAVWPKLRGGAMWTGLRGGAVPCKMPRRTLLLRTTAAAAAAIAATAATAVTVTTMATAATATTTATAATAGAALEVGLAALPTHELCRSDRCAILASPRVPSALREALRAASREEL